METITVTKGSHNPFMPSNNPSYNYYVSFKQGGYQYTITTVEEVMHYHLISAWRKAGYNVIFIEQQ